jgi:capsular polysaccharide biosynthesis protein
LEKFTTNDFVLIYPEIWKNFTFVNETLEQIPNLQIKLIEDGVHLFIPKLILTDIKPWTPMFIPREVVLTREFLYKISNKYSIETKEDNCRVYISRSAAKRRKFINEEEVENLFKKYDYKIVQMEELSFFQQIQLMKKTTLLAGLTGAGLINIMFMKENGAFLDLSNERYKNKTQYKFHFFKLCNILNITYSICFFKSETTKNIDHWSNENLIADINTIEKEIIKQIEDVEKRRK